jgi:hypothetical protein
VVSLLLRQFPLDPGQVGGMSMKPDEKAEHPSVHSLRQSSNPLDEWTLTPIQNTLSSISPETEN